MNSYLETPISPPNYIPNWLLIAFSIASALGFVDATYLTVKHFLGTPVTCSILHGCEVVTTSQYATIGGLPVALLGSLYYFTVLILTALYYQTRHVTLFRIANILTFVGFALSLRFVYLQIFTIKAICIFCMGSAITSTILCILSLISLRKKSIL